ncbi:UNVERIFIED_CONTAM: hypothetical protein FKN15_057520 [Acipenser sinensis]
MTPKTMNAADARTEGYFINSTTSRVLFRSPYGMPKSEVVMVAGIPVEAIRATVFYKQRWMLLLVDTSAACAKNPSVFDGTYLSWVTPRLLSPLVLHPTKFVDKQIKMGVEGRPLDEITATSRGYQLLVNSTAVKISIPFGAVGGYRKSHVIDNKYNQMYAIDLFLEHQWADDLWEVTQHRSFKPVRSPYLPETPYVVNNTIPSEKGFTVTLGNFKPDVELKNLTINGVPLTLPEAENRGVKITEVKHPNGTKNFVLKVPFAHSLIPEQYIGDNYRRYPLNINYTLNIIPVNEPYFHPATIVCDVQDVVHPDVKGICTNTSIVFEVTPGNMDYQWELSIGEEPLTPELVARRGYTMTSQPKIRVELPLFSIGYIYEDITLRGLIGKVVLILRDMKSLKEEDRFEQRCPFPTNEMLVCMPNGVMSVLVVPMAPVPPVNLARTTLLDQNCRPSEATSDRALFTFRVNTCGTRSKIDNNYLVYENEVLYSQELFPANAPVITRDSEYRLTIRCRYPVSDSRKIFAERKLVPAPGSFTAKGEGTLQLQSAYYSGDKRSRDVLNLKARLARGNFVTECRDRYFWMSTNGRFAGGSFRFDVIDGNGIHPLNDSYAATCGFTYSFNLPGDLIFRASFLACHVQSMNDVSYVLQYRFVRMDSLGRETVYPFSLSCSTESPWNPREVVCEENYMEEECSSYRSGRTGKGRLGSSTLHSPGSSDVRVAGRVPPDRDDPQNHELCRRPYRGVLHQLHNQPRRLLIALRHAKVRGGHDPSVFDGTYLSWVTPRLLSPLVLHPTKFVDKQIKMGVEGRPLDEITATSRGYQLLVNSTVVKISIPFGAVGGYRKSHVIENKYNQMYAIDLFLEHQWADDLWEVTQHRSFKPVRSPYLPETPYVVNNTIPSEKGFTVTLGNFKPDVELKNLTINGVPLTLPEAENRGVKITEVKHPNGTKNFVLKVPFAHPLIPEQYIGDNYRRYLLNINYTLNIIPVNEPYFHPATIVCDVQDVVHPDVKGICTNTSIVFEVTPGNMDYQWELCIGEEPLTPELVARRGYTMTSQPKIRVELPLFSIGYIYEDITLRGLIGKVVLILRDMKSLKEEDRFEQRCPFPTNEMLVCMPNGVMSVLVVPMAPVPPVNLARTTLLDQNCRPTEATSDRALFTFRVNTCGTRSKVYFHCMAVVCDPNLEDTCNKTCVPGEERSDGNGIHPLNDSYAATCGFTYSFNLPGDLIFRASFLACHVQSMVSVRKNVPVIAQEGLAKEDWEAALSIAQEAVMSVWQVVFHQTGMTPKTMNAADARTEGYFINSTTSRVLFRSPYGMPKSEVVMCMVEVDLQVQCKRVGLEEPVRCEARPGLCSNALLYPQVAGIPVEAIRATVFYKQRWMLLLVDTSAACAKNPSVFDGTYLSWVTPRLLSPLVLHPTKFVDKQIKMGVEGRPLDEITATSRGYQLQVNSTVVKISIPFGAVGGYRKDITLRGLIGKVVLILRDMKSLKEEDRFEQRCPFPTNEMLVCMPNGVMSVLVVPMAPVPPVNLARTTLLDQNCRPTEATSDRALFTFRVNTCGTRSKIDKNYLVYENEVIYSRELFPANAPIITRDSEYRLTIRCRYPVSDSRKIFAERKLVPAPGSFTAKGEGTLQLQSAYYSGDKRSRDVLNLKARLARAAWSLEIPTGLCSTQCQPGPPPTSRGLRSRHSSLARTLPSGDRAASPSSPPPQVYFHCMAVVCDPNLEDTCNKTCVPGEERSARSVDRHSQIRGYASAGPVQLVPEGGVVDLKTAAAWSLEIPTGLCSTQCQPGPPPTSRGLRSRHSSLARTLPSGDRAASPSSPPPQVYFHCMAVVCDPNLEDTCNKTCVPGEKRSARSVDRYSQIRGYASAGPVQLVPEGVVDLKTAGNFVTECRDRYFWMSTNGRFAGGSFRFDVIDGNGIHPLNDSYAATCGFTYSFNLPGDLIFRASFLACHNDVSYVLQYRFVRMDSLGRETVYPFSLSCSTESPWNPREVVCEENYMEVSVRKNVPVIAQEGLAKEDWEAALSIAQEAVMSVWQVVFHQTGMTPKTMNAADARTEGYFINSTTSRVLFRSPYGMPKSEVVMVAGIPVEAIRATVFYKQRWMLLLVDTSAACAKNPSVFDGTYLSWVTPRLLSPLVLHPTKFVDKQIKMGVEGRPLDEITATSRGYQLLVNSTAVKISIPFGAVGGYRKYIGDNYRRYLLNINYTLNIIPVNEPYFHPATIVCDVQDVVHPDVKGICTNTSIVFEVTPGNMDYQWELCIGEEPLTPELVARRGYTMTSQPKIRVELPLFSIGYIYEDITLRGLIGKVVLILRDMKSLKEEDRFEQRCPFPTNEMLVCMPNGVMSVLVVPMAPVPPVNLARTTLLDQNCRPTEATSDRALFTFRVNTCGTRSKIDKNYLVYENEVIYSRELFPANAPVITRDSEYRLTIRCRYPVSDSRKIFAERKLVPAPGSFTAKGEGTLQLQSAYYSGDKRSRDVLNLKARLARDVSYSQFYSAFPVSQSLLEPLFLQVELLNPHSLADRLFLQDCWATLTPELDASPQWDLVTDGAASPSSPPPQVYFHCMAVVCDPNLEDTCNKTCVPGEKRSARSVDRYSQIRGYASAGPVQLVPEGVVDLKTAGETSVKYPSGFQSGFDAMEYIIGMKAN